MIPKPIASLTFSVTAVSLLGTSAKAADLTLRKNVVDLTVAEKQDLVEAIYTLKNTVAEGDQISIYDQFVAVHLGAMSMIHRHGADEVGPDFSASFDAAHGNSSFLPWHREYILRFEEALQSVNRDVTLPYWDWTQAEAVDVIFQKDFLGTNGQGVPVEFPEGNAPNTDSIPNQGDVWVFWRRQQLRFSWHSKKAHY